MALLTLLDLAVAGAQITRGVVAISQITLMSLMRRPRFWDPSAFDGDAS